MLGTKNFSNGSEWLQLTKRQVDWSVSRIFAGWSAEQCRAHLAALRRRPGVETIESRAMLLTNGTGGH